MANEAADNWARYEYAKQRGHLDYVDQANKCEGMYLGAGEQWGAADKAYLKEQHRPFYEFNEIMPSVNSAVGYQIQNRMDIAFKPRGGASDLEKATILSKVVMQIAAASKLHWKETQVFTDGLVQQRGYFDVRMDFDSNLKGEVQVITLDPLDVIPDPDSKSYDPDDWADVIISRWLTRDQITQLYGKPAGKTADDSNDDGPDFGTLDDEQDRNKFGNNDGVSRYDATGVIDDGHKRYRVIDRQQLVYQNTKCIVWPLTGDICVEDDMSADSIADALVNGAIRAKRMRRRIKWTVTTMTATLFDDISPYEHFTVVPYFAYFRRGKTRGMVDNAIGPQEALNKAVSQFVHIINTSANSGWITEQNSITNMSGDDLEKRGAMTGLHIEIKEGSKAPQKITANPVPTGVTHLIDRATQALKDVTVPDSMRGLQGSAVSGVAKQADQFASQQQLAVPLDNLAFTRQLLAVRVMKLVQRYYDTHRIFRITETDPNTGKEVESSIEINRFDPATGGYLNDMTIGTYDVVITEQPMQVTFENSQFNQAIQMRKEGVAIPDATVVRYSSLSDKHNILSTMQGSVPQVNPVDVAKAKLIDAQTRKAEADTTDVAVRTQYSAIQTAQVIAQTPQTSGLADSLLKSAGYVDHDAGPIVPQAPAGTPSIDLPRNSDPLTPAGAEVGIQHGLETQAADGILS